MMKAEMIDKYLRNEMDGQEKDLFDSRLRSDAGLRAAFELTRDIAKSIQETEVIHLRNQLDMIHEGLFNSNSEKTRIIPLRWIRTAAAVMAIALATTLYLWNNGAVDSSGLISEYYAPYESTMRVRSSSQADDIVANAMAAYDMKQYKAAVTLFDEALAGNPEKMAINLYAGIANMETGNYNKAENLFNTIINNNNSPYVEHARWYVAFSYLMSNKVNEAKGMFGEIAENKDGFYNKKAKLLTRKLNRIK